MAKIDVSRFEHVGANTQEREGISRPSTSYWKDAIGRFKRNKAAVVCFFILVLIIGLAIFVPILSPYSISEQHLDFTNQGMFAKEADGSFHLLGTDSLGRDAFTRLWSGARVSLTIAFAAALISCGIGIVYGGISGYAGGVVDDIMMRIVELVSGIPYLIIVILLMMILEPGMKTMIFAYAIMGWTGMARLVRGQVMSLKEQEYVVAAEVLGASSKRILFQHLLPNSLSIIIINVTLDIPSAIFTEAFLSYIGLGVRVPLASWGTLANNGAQVYRMYPEQLFLPALCISLTMFAFNIMGDGLRDAFDPKLRR